MVFTANMSCHPDLAPCPADEGSVFCHSDPTTCPTREVDSPVEAGEVADEVRQKGAPPPRGSQKTQDTGYPVEGVQGIFSANVMPFFRVTAFLFPKKEQLLSESVFSANIMHSFG